MSSVYKRCVKCGSAQAHMHYDKVMDLLKYVCSSCGYTWTERPLDRDEEVEV